MKASNQECAGPSCSSVVQDGNEPPARPIARLLQRLKRRVSSPPVPHAGDGRSAFPQLFAVRSAKVVDKRYVTRSNDGAICESSQINAVQDRVRKSLFGVRKWKNQRGSGGRVSESTQIRFENSNADGGNGGPLAKLYTNYSESSRELSKIFEEDPDARSEIFNSLQAIENYN